MYVDFKERLRSACLPRVQSPAPKVFSAVPASPFLPSPFATSPITDARCRVKAIPVVELKRLAGPYHPFEPSVHPVDFPLSLSHELPCPGFQRRQALLDPSGAPMPPCLSLFRLLAKERTKVDSFPTQLFIKVKGFSWEGSLGGETCAYICI